MSEPTLFDEVLDQYRHDGYEVQREPCGPDLPPYLTDAQIDAVARKGTQTVIFQAQVHSGNGNEQPPAVIVTDEPDTAYAKSLLNEAELLLSAATARAALLVSWAAAEAAMRAIAQQAAIPSDRLTPRRLLEELFSRRAISEEDFLGLRYYMSLRNAIAHGFRPNDLPPEAVFLLITLTRRLLEPMAGREQGRSRGALVIAVSGGSRERLDEVERTVRSATGILEAIVGDSPGIVAAAWEKAEDALGQPVLTLRLSDFTGKVTATFAPGELNDQDHMRLRLRRLWGDLLQARSDKMREELLKLRSKEQ
jgi:hypothetical protein